ncbi:uncharacterized protein LOC113322546 [Papaver somniferum]|uniref:uncharacterized protein LOC113322546 n=1 Tax=Papaver somniferum TaxID=3469 RepID=UPI000E70131C|nr:uncharacterized protein LOC113322546 [Papaver somniferum]
MSLVRYLTEIDRIFTFFLVWMVKHGKAHELLVKRPEVVSWNLSSDEDDILLQLQQGKIFVKRLPMDNVYFELNFFFNPTLPTGISFHCCFKFIDKVIDSGKVIQLFEGCSYFVDDYAVHLNKDTSCVIVFRGSALLERYNGVIFSKLPESAAWNFWSVGVDHLLQHKMGKVGYNLIMDVYNSVFLDFVRSLFDRGKVIGLLLGVSYFSTLDSKFGHQMKVWFTDFLLFVLAKLGDNGDTSKLLVKMSRRGYLTNSFPMLLRMQIGGIQNAYKCSCAQSSEKWGEAFSLIQLKCGLLVGIAVHSCALLFVLPPGLASLICVPFDTLLVYCQGLVELRVGALILPVLRFPMESFKIGINDSRSIFDRGKGFQHMRSYSCFVKVYFCQDTMGSMFKNGVYGMI